MKGVVVVAAAALLVWLVASAILPARTVRDLVTGLTATEARRGSIVGCVADDAQLQSDLVHPGSTNCFRCKLILGVFCGCIGWMYLGNDDGNKEGRGGGGSFLLVVGDSELLSVRVSDVLVLVHYSTCYC